MNKHASEEPSEGRIDSEHARIVAEVLQDQARRQAVRDAATSPAAERADTSFFVQVGLLVAGTFFFYLLFFSPAWIAPTAAEPISAQQVEDGLRVAIYRAASEVEQFRRIEGRLPRTIDELGGPKDGVRYERIDTETFVVQATTGDQTLRYVSSEALNDFVGDAWQRVLGGTS